LPKKTTKRDPLLAEREKTHGDFGEQARVSQQLKAIFRSAPNWAAMPWPEKEAFELKATKLARHLCGDFMNPEHLTDDVGYARLILERMPPREAAPRRNGRRAR